MSVLLATLLLFGQHPSAHFDESSNRQVSFDVQLVDCEAIGWREAYTSRLRFGGHRSGCSSWISDHETLTQLVNHFGSLADASLARVPSVATDFGDSALVSVCATRHFVVHAEPGEAQLEEGKNPGTVPVVAPIDDGLQIRLIGQPCLEGILLNVEVIDTKIDAVHIVETNVPEDGRSETAVTVQVPEVSHQEVSGEWLIPTHHGLILSLGVDSVVGDDGDLLVRERLVLISPKLTSMSHSTPRVDTRFHQAHLERSAHYHSDPMLAPMAINSVDDVLSTLAKKVFIHSLGTPIALRETPWGLLPIVPVEVYFTHPNVVHGSTVASSMPVPELPSRTLPQAVDIHGQAIDPRRETDRAAERTKYSPFVDGKPVPSPQVTVSSGGEDSGKAPPNPMSLSEVVDADSASHSPVKCRRSEPKRDTAISSVRISINPAHGLSIDIRFDDDSDEAGTIANSGEPSARR